MNTKDGGPAFPNYEELSRFDEEKGRYVDYYLPTGGMSLRDYFAAAALQGSLANPQGYSYPSEAVRFAYEVADAMLAAREKQS